MLFMRRSNQLFQGDFFCEFREYPIAFFTDYPKIAILNFMVFVPRKVIAWVNFSFSYYLRLPTCYRLICVFYVHIITVERLASGAREGGRNYP